MGILMPAVRRVWEFHTNRDGYWRSIWSPSCRWIYVQECSEAYLLVSLCSFMRWELPIKCVVVTTSLSFSNGLIRTYWLVQSIRFRTGVVFQDVSAQHVNSALQRRFLNCARGSPGYLTPRHRLSLEQIQSVLFEVRRIMMNRTNVMSLLWLGLAWVLLSELDCLRD